MYKYEHIYIQIDSACAKRFIKGMHNQVSLEMTAFDKAPMSQGPLSAFANPA